MELKPDISKLMRREIYTFLTITLATILFFLIIHVLVVVFDPEVSNNEFIRNVWPWVVGSLVIFWALTPWLTYLWIINLKYSIEEERLVIHKGFLTKKNVSIPFSAVTDFTLSRSLYERWIGIGTLLVQTAGQGPQAAVHEGKLEGLVDFETIHADLRAKVRIHRGAGPGTAASDPKTTGSDTEILQSILEEVKRIGRKLD